MSHQVVIHSGTLGMAVAVMNRFCKMCHQGTGISDPMLIFKKTPSPGLGSAHVGRTPLKKRGKKKRAFQAAFRSGERSFRCRNLPLHFSPEWLRNPKTPTGCRFHP